MRRRCDVCGTPPQGQRSSAVRPLPACMSRAASSVLRPQVSGNEPFSGCGAATRPEHETQSARSWVGSLRTKKYRSLTSVSSHQEHELARPASGQRGVRAWGFGQWKSLLDMDAELALVDEAAESLQAWTIW